MSPAPAPRVLWVGPRHSGKTSAAARLADRARARGFSVAGLLAPSHWSEGNLLGFDTVDLRTGRRAPLARRAAPHGADAGQPPPGASGQMPDVPHRAGPFVLSNDGLTVGFEALSPAATDGADLVIVDEFGPLELRGGGWRPAADRLVASARGAVLLVVRESVVAEVRQTYPSQEFREIPAAHPRAMNQILDLLRGKS